GADVRRGGEGGVELAVERVLQRDLRGESARQVTAHHELQAGIAGQAVNIQVVVELIPVSAQARRRKRAAPVVGQLRRSLVLGDLRHAKAGDVARLHVEVLQLAGEI